jgi:hypothetical protein
MAGYRRSRVLWDEARRPGAPMICVIRAILYELQPVRLSSIDTLLWRVRGQLLINGISKFVTQTVPWTIRTGITFLQSLSTKTWTLILAGLLYYAALRVIHSYVLPVGLECVASHVFDYKCLWAHVLAPHLSLLNPPLGTSTYISNTHTHILDSWMLDHW